MPVAMATTARRTPPSAQATQILPRIGNFFLKGSITAWAILVTRITLGIFQLRNKLFWWLSFAPFLSPELAPFCMG